MDAALILACEIAKEFEGLSLVPYFDPVGYKTIGYGHLLSRNRWAPLETTEPITEKEAHALLQRDMEKAAASVARLIHVDLTDYQRAALIDFAFNCGGGNLQSSTLRRVINRGEFTAAPKQFMRWVYAGNVRLAGLVRRRAAEVDYFVS